MLLLEVITRQIHQTLNLWLAILCYTNTQTYTQTALRGYKPYSEANSCMSLWIHTFEFDNVVFNSYLFAEYHGKLKLNFIVLPGEPLL